MCALKAFEKALELESVKLIHMKDMITAPMLFSPLKKSLLKELVIWVKIFLLCDFLLLMLKEGRYNITG